MNKRLALVPLIQQSFLLSSDVKIVLLERLKEFEEVDIVRLGEYLRDEREFVLANAQKITEYAYTLIDYIEWDKSTATNKVYVGTGKPSSS